MLVASQTQWLTVGPAKDATAQTIFSFGAPKKGLTAIRLMRSWKATLRALPWQARVSVWGQSQGGRHTRGLRRLLPTFDSEFLDHDARLIPCRSGCLAWPSASPYDAKYEQLVPKGVGAAICTRIRDGWVGSQGLRFTSDLRPTLPPKA